MIRAMQEQLLFLYKFMRAPRQIGSVAPSSVFLAKKMLEPVQWSQVRSVAELGVGTGAITRHLAQVLHKEANVLLFEKDQQMRSQLSERFRHFACYADACNMQHALRKEGIDGLDCILSGLPFFNFSPALREQLMCQIETTLKPGGLFIAFQYSQQMRKQLSQRFEIERVHFIPLNVPPAFVYVCRKRGVSR
ncbi:class I SAM-dependent methyltransferase [Paenibacillus anseongense]|uniref:class I SAM-dependent methyltransferase n=1 Tax=Paenibacillus TaxID=44249 RepID=UPI002DBB5A79|nr:methyltransferase domain-containing protein [Paenibacillus anseongense]MEC0269498.1 methyltransferase domain-containing protein [Paenibacillus anseongense]